MFPDLLRAFWPLLLILVAWIVMSIYGSRRVARTKTPKISEIQRKPDHITLVRRPSVVDITRYYRVEIDGRNVGTIGAGEVGQYPVAPGKHAVVLKIDWCRSLAAEVEMGIGENVLLDCGATYANWRCMLAPFLWAKSYLYVRHIAASDT
jgi:hypothetical protein